jgi:branched-chain amino acid transport system substrate-binding protein
MKLGSILTAPLVVAAALLPVGRATAADDGPVKIGVITDMSSVLAAVSGPGSVDGARMAIEDFGGSVLGKPIELVSVDHQGKPDIASATARRWFDQEGVDMTMDFVSSAVGIAVLNVAKEKNKITLVTGAASSDFTSKLCTDKSFHWGYDTYQQSSVVPPALVKEGFDTWFFITADYAFGHALERDATRKIEQAGGKVVGGVRSPINTPDYSSFLLQAISSGAKVVGIAAATDDLQRLVKQAREFNLITAERKAVALPIQATDVYGVGLEAMQGVRFSTVFYWDYDEKTRGFSKRFEARNGKPPSEVHAMNYSAVLHYLKAVKAAGSKDTAAIANKMRELPVEDAVTSPPAHIREDGRLLRTVYLGEVKKPSESKGGWDLYKDLKPIPGEQAFRPVSESECPLVKK